MYATLDHADPLAPEPGRSPDLAPRAQTRLAGALPRDAAGMATGWSHPAQAAAQGARYGEDQRPNLVAMLGATAIVGGMIAAMLALNVVHGHQKARPRLVVAQLEQPRPPAPPPPRPSPQPVKHVVQTASPVVAPPPPLVLSAAPATITTSPAPPVLPVAVPGPPAPPAAAVAVSAPPRVENAGDLSSKMIAADPPRYPVDSRRNREQGTVVLLVVLGMDGRVADISVSRSSGFDRLDRAALSAVRHWKWSPTRRDGAAVMVRGLVEIPFVLHS
ncbi:outer membrane transport energization protein TonB [Novosphingobium sp. PhB57]|uniref:energy transducer TonB n=1 Tax=Novosphingobium sp. PhB57 TaxID=2485107 RepID=UPI0010E45B1C|nr:energy transducer TonB [Novosphingobium sp. PhB57]TCU57473.1 outer membrane transport energization protein TonB [Novosphingobium sp. PhB57]